MNIMLMVPHRGRNKYVGKVFMWHDELTFFHEESGNQQHVNLDAPGGVDWAVIEWLEDHNAHFVIHATKGERTALVSELPMFRLYGERRLYAARDRVYLRHEYWGRITKPSVPWCPQEVVIEPRGHLPEPRTKAAAAPVPPQLRLDIDG